MTDYRDRSPYRSPDDRYDEPATRWRRNEERYRRETTGAQTDRFGDNRFDDDRGNQANRDFGYGRTQDEGGGYGRGEQRPYAQRNYYAGRDYDREQRGRGDSQPVHHWHEQDHDRRAGHPYQGTYGGTGDSSWFTGSQGSWAVDEPRRSSAYYGGGYGAYGGGQRFGADYRQHGYDRDDDGRRGFWDRASDEVASWFGDEDAARRREQDHRGHGPKDYTRSDDRIREDANDRLTEDWRVDASNVTVTVDKGEITLNGTVTSREAKRRAEDVVDNISGVKHVQNNLRVQELRSGAGYSGNWATNTTSTAEGGTVSRSQTTDPTKQSNKV